MVQSVERAFLLLELLAAAGPEGMTLGDLAARAELKPPTAHNLVRTLEALGYARQDDSTRRYLLGPRAETLGRRARLVKRGQRVLESLRAATDESIVLATWADGLRRTLISAESGQALRVAVAAGTDDRFYETATGRLLLSQLSAQELAAFVARRGLPGAAWAGIDSLEALQRAVSAVGAQGWTRCDNAQAVCAWAVLVPGAGDPAALGLYCPATRVVPGREEEFLSALREAARQLADEP